MQKPSFVVVTWVVVTLCFLAFGGRVVSRYLPGPPTVETQGETVRRLVDREDRRIPWLPLSPEVFAEARSRNVPVLLFVGVPYEATSRRIREALFRSPEEQAMLRRGFVCTYVDADESPDLANAFFPLSRVESGPAMRGRLLVLDGEGRVFSEYPVGSIVDPLPSLRRSVASLAAIAREYAATPPDEADAVESAVRQTREVEALDRLIGRPFDPDASRQALRSTADLRAGGFRRGSVLEPIPIAWRAQLLLGEEEVVRTMLDRLLTSPMQNLAGGGLFDVGTFDGTRAFPTFDQSVARLGDTAVVLASLYRTTGEKGYGAFARDAIEGALRRFRSPEGTLWAGSVGETDGRGRSSLWSFSARSLREKVPDEPIREWMQQRLNLRPGDNPSMNPHLSRVDQRSSLAQLPERLEQLRRAQDVEEVFAGPGMLDHTGYALARLLEAARLLGDQALIERCMALVFGLEVFRAADDVNHQVLPGIRTPGQLPDYLAFADAMLHGALATGDPSLFDTGLRVLRRAIFLFGSGNPATYRLVATPSFGVRGANPPEVLDGRRESATAMLARLAWAYGICANAPDLVKTGTEVSERYSALAAELGPYAAGVLAAGALQSDPVWFVVKGPGATDRVRKLEAVRPLRPVAIHNEALFPQLKGRPDGVYRVVGSLVEGPFELDEALEKAKG